MFQRGELGGITGIDPVERWFELFGDGPQSPSTPLRAGSLHGIPTPIMGTIKEYNRLESLLRNRP